MTNFGQKIKYIQHNLEIKAYTIVAKECVGLIEHALRQLFSQHLTRLQEQDRLKVQHAESEVGKGNKGIESFTMRELVGVFRKSKFLDAWACASGKDINSIRIINLNELTTLRNTFIHGDREATPAEAELLYNYLQVILETFELEPKQSASPDLKKKAGLLEKFFQQFEDALRQLFSQHLTRLKEQDRLRVQHAEREIGKGNKGIESFTMEELVDVFRKSKFLDAWTRISEKDLSSIKMINFDKFTMLHNKFTQGGWEATSIETDFLSNCLQVIHETFEIESKDAVSPDLSDKAELSQHFDVSVTDLFQQWKEGTLEEKELVEEVSKNLEIAVSKAKAGELKINNKQLENVEEIDNYLILHSKHLEEARLKAQRSGLRDDEQEVEKRERTWLKTIRDAITLIENLPAPEKIPKEEPSDKLLKEESRIQTEGPKQDKFIEKDKIAWNNAPVPLQEWVGREDLLKAITSDWTDPKCQVTGLIGLGGEGKSSLARKWTDGLHKGLLRNAPVPDGIFWWGFYTKPSVDEFFEAALRFMDLDPNKYQSTNAKVNVIKGMLSEQYYLFILDGLEVLQHTEGRRCNLLKNQFVREFLHSFVASGHRSFCLITSRAPLRDLEKSPSYTHHDITGLSSTDGKALLRAVGVKGDDKALGHVVTEWGGHALTLNLLGSYLVNRYKGNVVHIKVIPPPTADEPTYERVKRVLKRHDDDLNDAERAFLMIFSAFRKPVNETAFDKVFRSEKINDSSITELSDTAFEKMIECLVAYRILSYDPYANHYTAHPLVQSYYKELLKNNDFIQVQEVHQQIKNYYLDIADETQEDPTLKDLTPLMEAEHHTCCAGEYDEAFIILREKINQDRFLLPDRMGAWDTYLKLMEEFFPEKDISREPQLSSLENTCKILHEVGFCKMMIGQLDDAIRLDERTLTLRLKNEDWWGASCTYQNLVQLYAYLGELETSAESAQKALELARRVKDKKKRQEEKLNSLADQGWVAYLQGDLDVAKQAFKQAELILQKIEPSMPYLYELAGIGYADYLRRVGDRKLTRQVAEANLKWCIDEERREYIAMNHRVLGDLDVDAGKQESARIHYDEALRIARNIARRDVLIESLSSRGRWNAKYSHDISAAFSDLKEALEYARDGSYRIYETDIHIGFAWVHLSEALASKTSQAKMQALAQTRAEAEQARSISEEIGYKWGMVDAKEVTDRFRTGIES